MFNWRRSMPSADVLEDDLLTEAAPLEQTPSSKHYDHAFYTVGLTAGGDTVLKIHSNEGYGTTELKMNKAAVKQMIKLLECTLNEEIQE